LRLSHASRAVTLNGWVHRRRDQGGLIFIDLRDRYGITQIVINRDEAPDAHEAASRARSEYVLSVSGHVRARPEGTANPDLATGDTPVTVPGIVGDTSESCPDVGCPSLALAPGFAYVSNPAEGKVYEVHLEEAHIERELDEHFDAPTQLVVLGRFGYELEHSHGRHE